MDKNHFSIAAKNEDIYIRFEHLKSKLRGYTNLEIKTPEIDISYDFKEQRINLSSGIWRDRIKFLISLINILGKQLESPDRIVEVLIAYDFQIVLAK